MLAVKHLLSGGRTRRLIDLENKIAPAPEVDEIDEEVEARSIDLINGLSNGTFKSPEFSQYVETCLQDPQIAKLATKRKLTEDRFIRIFRMLATAGLNRHIKGRNVALATLADYTGLLYVVRAVRKGTDWQTISAELEGYWSGQIDPKTLLSQTTRSPA